MAEQSPEWVFAKKCLIALTFVALAATLYALGAIFLLIFASIVVAVILRAMARQFMSLGLPDGLSVTFAVLTLIAIIIAIAWIFGDLVANQFVVLGQRIPEAVEATQHQLDAWDIDYDIRRTSLDIGNQLAGMTTQAGSFAMSAGGVVANVVLVLAGAVFFAADPNLYRNSFRRLVPKGREKIIETACHESGHALGLWLQAQILSSIAVGTLTYLGLTLLGVPSAAALAIIAGALDFIPFVGAVVAGIPAVLIAFSGSPTLALWTVGLYLIIQQIQGNILQPIIQKRSVDLSPAVLLFAVVSAGTLFGIVGIILSAPLTVVAFVLVQRLYIEWILDKPASTPGPTPDNLEPEEE